ncbi:hypothetical protein KUCAC02_030443, partial [Chaenocephalus aceratus]
STYIAFPSTPQISTEYMIIAETATWRIGCKHPRERGRDTGSSELLYQLDGGCYFLRRQPISMRSVKDGQRTTKQPSTFSLGVTKCFEREVFPASLPPP